MPTPTREVLKIDVPVIVRLAERTLTVREVLQLQAGAIVELPKNAEDELELMINNKAIGCGSAVKIGENFGIRITFIGDISTRIAALGPQQKDDLENESAEALAEALLAGQFG